MVASMVTSVVYYMSQKPSHLVTANPDSRSCFTPASHISGGPQSLRRLHGPPATSKGYTTEEEMKPF